VRAFVRTEEPTFPLKYSRATMEKWSPFPIGGYNSMKAPLIIALSSAVFISIAPALAEPSPSPSAQAANQTSAGNPHVFVVDGNKQTEIGQIWAQAFLADHSHPGLVPSNHFTERMEYFLPNAPTGVASPSASFEVDIRSVPWADPAHITPVVIRLQQKDGHDHVVGSQTTTITLSSQVQTTDPIADERVDATVSVIATGRFRITPSQALSPGDYGIALRDPDVQPITRKTNNTGSAGVSKQQMYQSYVWPFTVNGSQKP